jgi:PAS domain S-box-containing protein
VKNLFDAVKLLSRNDATKQHSIHKSLKFAHRIINSSTDAILICEAEPIDEPGPRIVYVNNTFVKETGYTPEEVIGKTPRILQGPKTDLNTSRRIREALKKWQPIREEILNYKKNGEEFWVSLTIFPIANESGWFTHWIAIQHNITKVKIKEEELLLDKKELIAANKELIYKNNELNLQRQQYFLLHQQLQSTLSAIPDPIFELGLDGRYYECYAMKGELLAAPRDALVGKLVSKVLPVEAADIVMSALREANVKGLSRGKLFKLALQDGNHWFDLTVVRMDPSPADGVRFIVLSRDITASHNQAEKLQMRDLNFRFILENSPIAIRMASKATGLLVFVNKKYCELAELPAQDLIGTSREQFEVIEQDKSDLSEALLKQDVIQSKLVKLTNINKIKWALASGIEMEFEGDPVYLGWFYEITSQKESEYALLIAMSEAEKANQAKSKFLAAASHDLRQPLTALSLYVDVLTKRNNGDDSGLGKKIQGCVTSLSELLDNLLNVSKLDAGVVEPTNTVFSVDDLLTSLVNIHAAEAAQKGLSLHLRPTNLIAHTDHTILQRILGNLIANAIRYTDKGGILIGCRHHNGKQWIEVWDSGVGFPSNMAQHIFEEFTQLGDNSRRVGSGLGLAIVGKSAKLLGLELRVHSRPGRGSMFAIEIPHGDAALIETSPESKTVVDKWNIALVDDNPMVLEATAFGLTAVGHQVIAGESEFDLLKNIGYQEPDILISDYRLADNKTGLDLILNARATFGKDLPAILITGDTDPKLIKLFAKHKIKVCYKPLKIDVLNNLISEAMLNN